MAADVPLLQAIFDFHKKIYLLSQKLPKKDRFGIYVALEKLSLELINLIIQTAFETKQEKIAPLKKSRIVIETLKRLLRLMNELNIIPIKNNIPLQANLQEISKMTNGWIKYVT